MERNATGSEPGTTEGLQSRVETLEEQVDGLLRAFALMADYRARPPRAERHLSAVK